MSNTYTWSIERMDCHAQAQGQADVVFTVHWRCSGTDGTHEATIYSSAAVEFKGGEYTPYEQLTQEQVLGWIWAGGVDKDATEASLANQIELLVNPPVVSPPLPWSA
jgi:hypothetical protein